MLPRLSWHVDVPQSARSQLKRIHRMRVRNVVRIDQPLVMISQAQRSGGTLLSQLFAGHPQCHVHPGELSIGSPKKFVWPDLDLEASPRSWFRRLFEKPLARYEREGYAKVPPSVRKLYETSEITYPFVFSTKLQREIFESCAKTCEIRTQRDILDCYMTSYFNAWLDYQGIYDRARKYAVAFVPRLALYEQSVARYFEDYPDGRLISILRDPRTWFVSYQSKKPQRAARPAAAVELWKRSAVALLANKRCYRDRVYLLRFEVLLQNTDGVMRHLSRDLGLTFDEVLLRPTFQGMDIRANSSFRAETAGVLEGPLARTDRLTGEAREYVERETRDVYEAALEEMAELSSSGKEDVITSGGRG